MKRYELDQYADGDQMATSMVEAKDGEYVLHDDAMKIIGGLQAKIDALMLEHCPEEMTPEQRAKWREHQVVEKERSGR